MSCVFSCNVFCFHLKFLNERETLSHGAKETKTGQKHLLSLSLLLLLSLFPIFFLPFFRLPSVSLRPAEGKGGGGGGSERPGPSPKREFGRRKKGTSTFSPQRFYEKPKGKARSSFEKAPHILKGFLTEKTFPSGF